MIAVSSISHMANSQISRKTETTSCLRPGCQHWDREFNDRHSASPPLSARFYPTMDSTTPSPHAPVDVKRRTDGSSATNTRRLFGGGVEVEGTNGSYLNGNGRWNGLEKWGQVVVCCGKEIFGVVMRSTETEMQWYDLIFLKKNQYIVSFLDVAE